MASPVVDYTVVPNSGITPLTVTITLNSVMIDGFGFDPYSIAHFGFLKSNGAFDTLQMSHFGYYLASPTTSYLWKFGDGNTFVGETPGTHTYTTPGDYVLKLCLSVDGIVYEYPTTITVLASETSLVGLGQNPSRESLNYGNDETQGFGWSKNSGDGHLWPDSYGSVISTFNEDGDHEQLIFDSLTGLPYIYDTRKLTTSSNLAEVWKDKVNPLNEGSGTEITTRVKLQEYVGSHESYFQQMSDINLFYEPMYRARQDAVGYTAKGLRDAFEVDLELYADEKLDKVAHADNVPIDRELFFDRIVKGHIMQIAFETASSEYRFTGSEVYLTNYDHAVWPSQPDMTEKDYQSESSDLQGWLTRNQFKLLDLVTSESYGTSNDYDNVAGPDSLGGSAFQVNKLGDISFNKTVNDATVWSNDPAGPTITSSSPHELSVIGSFDTPEFPDDKTNPAVVTWYFLHIKSTESGPQYPFEFTFIDGIKYFDVRFYNVDATLSQKSIQYQFDDVKENNANAICKSWF
ncbi:MAG: PKD domain-containing protein [Alteromonadales bacterium]|nr:PKD domain-containing protein [Alteromonadales bacterium]